MSAVVPHDNGADTREIRLRHAYDMVLYSIAQKEAKVQQLRSQLSLLQTSQVEEDKRLRSLETRLDKALIKYHEAQSIRKAYESILSKLRKERLRFDTMAETVKATIREKRKEQHRLQKMGSEAEAVRSEAKVNHEPVHERVAEHPVYSSATCANDKVPFRQNLQIWNKEWCKSESLVTSVFISFAPP